MTLVLSLVIVWAALTVFGCAIAIRSIRSRRLVIQPASGRVLKGRIIAKFGSVNAAALHLGRHRNSIRAAWLGKCPGVLAELEEALR